MNFIGLRTKHTAFEYGGRITMGGSKENVQLGYEYISLGSNYSTSSDGRGSFLGTCGPSTELGCRSVSSLGDG
jgi:hypothetical protein